MKTESRGKTLGGREATMGRAESKKRLFLAMMP